MLLARLVTGRYGYAAPEEYSRPVATAAHGQTWLARLVAVFFARKHG